MDQTDQDITLSEDQQAAMDSFVEFLMDPEEQVWVLQGYSGTGKSTLIRILLDRMDSFDQLRQLVDPEWRPLPIHLTATTNKAAENLSQISGMRVSTIHSFLSLRVNKDVMTGRSELVPARNAVLHVNELIFIDEASMIDSNLLTLIFQQTYECKIVFIGDPAQLPPVKSTNTPVFASSFKGAMLSQVMRQQVDGVIQINPITELSTAFRHTVNTGIWPTGFTPDGEFVTWLPRNEFIHEIEKEFTRPDWSYRDSKILAWTNTCVIDYNRYVREKLKGDPALQEGDYAENNSFITVGKNSIKTDQMVQIHQIGCDTEHCDVSGNFMDLDNGSITVFHPHSREAKKAALATAQANDDYRLASIISNWIDLRAVFAQTINKSQGSTYDKVFIDLDDIKKCTNGNLIARMLYVAISRARKKVYLTGDIK